MPSMQHVMPNLPVLLTMSLMLNRLSAKLYMLHNMPYLIL